VSWSKTTIFGTLILAWLTTIGCSRKPVVESHDSSLGENRQLPFERAPNRSGFSPTSAIRFQGIPAGTPIRIRLQASLSSASAHAGDSFIAELAEPIVIQGHTVVPSGQMVVGRVVAARSSDGLQSPGYLRLTLASIMVSGKSQAVQTNSVFVKGGPRHEAAPPAANALSDRQQAATQDVQFSSGGRFTFRLKEALPSQS
jgi:hypothetical protein